MAGGLRTYVGALYNSAWFFLATGKADAGRQLFELIPEEYQRATSRAALARYVGPLYWCPEKRRLWFDMTVSHAPRLIFPNLVPPELWGGIEARRAEMPLDEAPRYGGKGDTEVSAADLRRFDGLGCAFVDAAAHVPFSRGAVTRNDSAALRIAHGIADTGDFSALPILADALEEAGCDSALLLDHCRKPGKHHPGCWVVELVRGKR